MDKTATAVIDSLYPDLKRQRMDLETFVQWLPPEEGRYELIDGIPEKMQPTGSHANVAGFLTAELTLEIRRQKLPYLTPKDCLV